MAGVPGGGLKASKKMYKLYGKDYYQRIGQMGGSKRGRKGFALNRELASAAGRVGGTVSRRKSFKNPIDQERYEQCLQHLEEVRALAMEKRLMVQIGDES